MTQNNQGNIKERVDLLIDKAEITKNIFERVLKRKREDLREKIAEIG